MIHLPIRSQTCCLPPGACEAPTPTPRRMGARGLVEFSRPARLQMHRPNLPPPSRRRAFTLTEMAVAFVVVAMALATLAQVGYWAARAHVRNQQYLLAVEHAANLIEELRASSVEELTPDHAGPRPLPDWLGRELGGGHAEVAIGPAETSHPGLRRIEVVVHWRENEPPQTAPPPVRLVAWLAARQALPKDNPGAP